MTWAFCDTPAPDQRNGRLAFLGHEEEGFEKLEVVPGPIDSEEIWLSKSGF